MAGSVHRVSSRRASRLVVGAVLFLAVALIAAFALHLAARSAERRSQDAGTIAEKAADARLAARLEPWNTGFEQRARVLTLWARGEKLLGDGDYNAAVDTLREAYRADVGNRELLELFKRAQAVQALETNKKAHLQHGHEGPGGTLQPQDIER